MFISNLGYRKLFVHVILWALAGILEKMDNRIYPPDTLSFRSDYGPRRNESLVRVSLHISYRLHESQCTTLILESDYGPLRNESLVRVSLHRFHRFHSTLVLKSDYGKANRLTSIGTSCFFSHQILRHVRYVHSRIGLWPPPKWDTPGKGQPPCRYIFFSYQIIWNI